MKNRALLLLLAGIMPLTAWSAGGHYPVDDADITTPGHFQIDTWLTRSDGSNSEFAFLPAWTPTGTSLELTAGFIRIEEDGDSFNRFEPAAKWQFSPMTPGRVAFAAALEVGYEDSDLVDWLLNLPISYELANAPVVLHGNIGWIRDRINGNSDRAFIGTAIEWDAADHFDLIGQLYREGADEDPEAQLGLRFGLNGPLEHIDIAAGRSLRGQEDWSFTLGMALAF